MNPAGSGQLPKLGVADFGPGLDHVAEAYQNGRVFAIARRDDPVRQHLPGLLLDPADPCAYVFVHGGLEVSRFENMPVGTHEIPGSVVAELVVNHYGAQLDGMSVRMCTCYGNMLRPGDIATAVQGLARLLPRASFQGYHGLVYVDAVLMPPRVVLGNAVGWDPVSGPYYLHPPVPGQWEIVGP
jgi:hypothetical protein